MTEGLKPPCLEGACKYGAGSAVLQKTCKVYYELLPKVGGEWLLQEQPCGFRVGVKLMFATDHELRTIHDRLDTELGYEGMDLSEDETADR